MANPKVIIIGAGPAGTRAATEFVEAGITPVVIDESPLSGGQIYRRQPHNFIRTPNELYGTEVRKAVNLHKSFDAIVSKIDYRPSALAWAVQDGQVHLLTQKGDQKFVGKEAFDALIIATGATDRILPLPGWTLPGCYTLGGTQIALKVQGCAIGQRVVLLGTGPLLYLLAWQYMKAGHPPVAVLDTTPFANQLKALPWLASRPVQLLKGMRLVNDVKRAGIVIYRGTVPAEILGTAAGVQAIAFKASDGKEHTIACDAVAMGYHIRAESQLADLAGCDFYFESKMRQWLPKIDDFGRTSVSGIYLAGDCATLLGADAAEIAGTLAARAAIADLTALPVGDSRPLVRKMQQLRRFAYGISKAFPLPHDLVRKLPDSTILCRCEEIRVGDMRAAATALDAPEVNRAKAFSRAGMGRCQGRFCGIASQEIVSAQRREPLEYAGRIRSQAPVKPLPVSVKSEENYG